MAGKDGRNATQPYRVRVGAVWYWVDPTVPADAIEPGDFVVIYPAVGDVVVATLDGPRTSENGLLALSTLANERFTVPAREIVALHLAAVDEIQS